MHNTLKSVLVVCAFYSFGTFGFLNLFDARLVMQLILSVAVLVFLVVFSRQIKGTSTHFLILAIFFCLYGLGMIATIGTAVVLIETFCMLGIAILIVHAKPKFVLNVAKILVSTSFVLCALVAAAFTYYLLFPGAANHANLDIYGSATGSEAIYPGHLLDYLSFISNGYEVAGLNILRMKGYSNEPSATIVHYLAPCALAFLLGGVYAYLGVFCLIVNIVAISSFLSFLILLSSLPLYYLLRLRKGPFRTYIAWGMLIGGIYALRIDGLRDLQQGVGDWFYGTLQYDFLSRKEGSLDVRARGFSTDLDMLISSPLGWWGESNAGAIFSLASKGGWILVLIYCIWVRKLLSGIERSFLNASKIGYRWGLSLIVSIVLFATIVSGYGWDRIPGVIMMLLFFRILDDRVHSKSEPSLGPQQTADGVLAR